MNWHEFQVNLHEFVCVLDWHDFVCVLNYVIKLAFFLTECKWETDST